MSALVLECSIHLKSGRRGWKRIVIGPKPVQKQGRVPKISRYMALAIKLDRLIQEGKVAGYADLAKLAGVDCSRLSRIMNLRLLATEIQEKLLFLPEVVHGPDPITLKDVLPLVKEQDWARQRERWHTSEIF